MPRSDPARPRRIPVAQLLAEARSREQRLLGLVERMAQRYAVALAMMEQASEDIADDVAALRIEIRDAAKE